jgi:Peptidase family M1 domain
MRREGDSGRRRMPVRLLLLFGLSACSTAPVGAEPSPLITKSNRPKSATQSLLGTALSGDIRTIDIHLDLATRHASARYAVDLPATDRPVVELEVRGVDVKRVYSTTSGETIPSSTFKVGKHEVLRIDAQLGANDFAIDYDFSDDAHNGTERGWSVSRQNTLLWPDGCSALFPCHSDPNDGAEMKLEVVNPPAGMQLIYPAHIPADSPSYMLAFAYGNMSQFDAGHTRSGTHLSGFVYTHEGAPLDYAEHLEQLRREFEWLEDTIGPYIFGNDVASLVMPNGYGGMEHHPYWYVESIQADTHEAAHGWFGNGVREACWEDLVVSEGFAEYLSIRAPRALADKHDGYDAFLSSGRGPRPRPGKNGAWLPKTCNNEDAYATFNNVYSQGSGFLMELATRYGERAFDQLLSDFYLAHAGGAVRMQEFIDFAQARTTVDIRALAEKWLL